MTTSTGDEEIDRAIVGLAQSRAQLCAILGNATAANAALATPFPRSAAFRALLSLPAARSPPKLSAKKDTPHKTHLPGGKGDDRGGAGASASGRGSAASPLPTVLTVHKNPLLRQGLTKRSMVLSTKKETPHKAHLLGGEGGAGAAAGGSGSSASPLPTVHKNPLLLQGLPKKYMVLEDMFGEFATSSRPCSSPFLCMRSHTWRTASQVAAR